MKVDIKTMPELRLATVGHIGPYNQIPVAFERLGEHLGAVAPELRHAGSMMIAMYHDDPESVPVDQLRSDAAVVVSEDFVIPHGLVDSASPRVGSPARCMLVRTNSSATHGRDSW